MAVSVGPGVDDRAPSTAKADVYRRKWAAQSAPPSPDDLVPFAREILAPICCCFARISTVCCIALSGSGMTIWTTSDAPTITYAILALCSAPCKARRCAPPALRAAFGP